MSIDSRTMKVMLQQQLAPNPTYYTSRSSAQDADRMNTAFQSILSAHLGTQGQDGNALQAALPVWSEQLWAQVSPVAGLDVSGIAGIERAFAGAEPYNGLVSQAARKYGVDESLIHAVIRTESGYRADAESHAGAKGLMQLMDGTARSLGVADSFDPAQNIDGGTRYLAFLLRKYNGNESVALAAYNAGPGRIDRLGIATDEELRAKLQELPEETRNYVAKIAAAKLSWL